MTTNSVFSQVSPFIQFAVDYVEGKFGVEEKAALKVVSDVLMGLLSKPDGNLSNPKRYLLRACRWKALRSIRRRRAPEEVRLTAEAPEILVALEEADRARFFGRTSRPEPEPIHAVCKEPAPAELSATVEVPGSVIRVSFSLSKFNQKAC